MFTKLLLTLLGIAIVFAHPSKENDDDFQIPDTVLDIYTEALMKAKATYKNIKKSVLKWLDEKMNSEKYAELERLQKILKKLSDESSAVIAKKQSEEKAALKELDEQQKVFDNVLFKLQERKNAYNKAKIDFKHARDSYSEEIWKVVSKIELISYKDENLGRK